MSTIRKFTNVSGSPDKRKEGINIRRQSPVIGGARLYPGTTVTYSEADWSELGHNTQLLLMGLVEAGVFDYEEISEKQDIPVLPKVENEVQVKKEEIVPEDDENVGLEEESETKTESEKVFEESKVTVEEKIGESVSFDYEGFLDQSVKLIRATNFDKLDPKPNIERLIALEKENKNRSTIIAWCERQSN